MTHLIIAHLIEINTQLGKANWDAVDEVWASLPKDLKKTWISNIIKTSLELFSFRLKNSMYFGDIRRNLKLCLKEEPAQIPRCERWRNVHCGHSTSTVHWQPPQSPAAPRLDRRLPHGTKQTRIRCVPASCTISLLPSRELGKPNTIKPFKVMESGDDKTLYHLS